MRHTPWYAGTTKPARVGVYERRFPNGAVLFALWDGYKWRRPEPFAARAAKAHRFSMYQPTDRGVPHAQWRGLTTKPK